MRTLTTYNFTNSLHNQNFYAPRLPKPTHQLPTTSPFSINVEFITDETILDQHTNINKNLSDSYKGLFSFASSARISKQINLFFNWLSFKYFYIFIFNINKLRKQLGAGLVITSSIKKFFFLQKFKPFHTQSRLVLYFSCASRFNLVMDKNFLFFHFFLKNNFKFFQSSFFSTFFFKENNFYLPKLIINRLQLQKRHVRQTFFLIKKKYHITSQNFFPNFSRNLSQKFKFIKLFFFKKIYNKRRAWFYFLSANPLSLKFNLFFLKQKTSLFFTNISNYFDETPISLFAGASHVENFEFLNFDHRQFFFLRSNSKIFLYFNIFNSFESRFPFLYFRSYSLNLKYRILSRITSLLFDLDNWPEVDCNLNIGSFVLPAIDGGLRENSMTFSSRRLVSSYSRNSASELLSFSRFEAALFFFFKPLFFKTLILINWFFEYPIRFKVALSQAYRSFCEKSLFYTASTPFSFNTVMPNEFFNYIIKKKIIKVLDYSRFSPSSFFWHYNILIRFLEYSSGKKVYLRLHPFLISNLNISEKLQCLMWAQKVKYFRKVLGPRLFLNESLQIIYLSLKYHDPFMLSNWMVGMLRRISFWKLKTFLRYIKYVLRYFFWVVFDQLSVRGVKFQLKGKVSVSGNARTRTVFHSVGLAGHSTFNNRILFNLNLVKTFTGVLGLKLWIIF